MGAGGTMPAQVILLPEAKKAELVVAPDAVKSGHLVACTQEALWILDLSSGRGGGLMKS